MTLDIIGAGFGRTGTQSMKRALELLGFGPCHHMEEVITKSDVQLPLWHNTAMSKNRDWDHIFRGYRSSIDWPSAFFWRELSEHYPDARVLLTVRSSESWYKSFSNTIQKIMRDPSQIPAHEDRLFAEMVWEIVNLGSLDGGMSDKTKAVEKYEENIHLVQSTIPADRLLTYELGSGWEPLCDWLGVPVPDAPFPRGNTVEDFFKIGRKD